MVKLRGTIIGVMTILLMLHACSDDNYRPEVDQETMTEILTQIHLADGWVDLKGGSLTRRKDMRNDLYDEILDQYDLDRETFYRSYQYYTDRPFVLDSMYAKIVADLEEELERKREENMKQREINRDPKPEDTLTMQKRDSIRRLDSAKILKIAPSGQ